MASRSQGTKTGSVYYTHLTLPTNVRVSVEVGDVAVEDKSEH